MQQACDWRPGKKLAIFLFDKVCVIVVPQQFQNIETIIEICLSGNTAISIPVLQTEPF